MKPLATLYLERANNELAAAEVLFQISDKSEMQKQFELEKTFTFYSGVISHAYYSIFNAAKAILAEDGTETGEDTRQDG